MCLCVFSFHAVIWLFYTVAFCRVSCYFLATQIERTHTHTPIFGRTGSTGAVGLTAHPAASFIVMAKLKIAASDNRGPSTDTKR